MNKLVVWRELGARELVFSSCMFLTPQRGSPSRISFQIFHKYPRLSLAPSQQTVQGISPSAWAPQAEKALRPLEEDKSL